MRAYARFVAGDRALEQRWLARILREWKPDIVHTLGIDPAGEMFFDVRRDHELEGASRWVLQTRGGSDLALSRFDPVRANRLAQVLREADTILSDNAVNFEIALDWGVSPERLSPIGTVPGTGGVDIELLAAHAAGQPSTRRVIVWPKAYECPWSKALPVFEALSQHWHRLPPCEIHMLATVPEVLVRTVVILAAKDLNPGLRVFARARYIQERAWLEEVGATGVVTEEAETAVGLAVLLLREVGADEQRVREEIRRIQDELSAHPAEEQAEKQ